jgi:hypothetical protein
MIDGSILFTFPHPTDRLWSPLSFLSTAGVLEVKTAGM